MSNGTHTVAFTFRQNTSPYPISAVTGTVTITVGTPPAGNIIGRVWKDDNGNGGKEDSEQLISDSGGGSAACIRYDLSGVLIHFEGPTSRDVTINGCIAGDPSYDSGQLPAGTYTVSIRFAWPMPWAVTTPAQTVGLDPGETEHRWFGIAPKGVILGRIWNDANGNGVPDAGEKYIRDPD